MERIGQEADEFVDWNELIQYFTKRGRPIPVERGFGNENLYKSDAIVAFNKIKTGDQY